MTVWDLVQITFWLSVAYACLYGIVVCCYVFYYFSSGKYKHFMGGEQNDRHD